MSKKNKDIWVWNPATNNYEIGDAHKQRMKYESNWILGADIVVAIALFVVCAFFMQGIVEWFSTLPDPATLTLEIQIRANPLGHLADLVFSKRGFGLFLMTVVVLGVFWLFHSHKSELRNRYLVLAWIFRGVRWIAAGWMLVAIAVVGRPPLDFFIMQKFTGIFAVIPDILLGFGAIGIITVVFLVVLGNLFLCLVMMNNYGGFNIWAQVFLLMLHLGEFILIGYMMLLFFPSNTYNYAVLPGMLASYFHWQLLEPELPNQHAVSAIGWWIKQLIAVVCVLVVVIVAFLIVAQPYLHVIKIIFE